MGGIERSHLGGSRVIIITQLHDKMRLLGTISIDCAAQLSKGRSRGINPSVGRGRPVDFPLVLDLSNGRGMVKEEPLPFLMSFNLGDG